MTTEIPTTKKRGRPFGSYGIKRRQEELIAEYTNALGGPDCTTPLEKREIARAVSLQAIAEERRAHINKNGVAASANELLALVRLEESASLAVEKLRLPCHRGFNPREEPVTSVNTFDATTLSPRGRAEALLLVVEAIEKAVNKLAGATEVPA
jgi:hypothetical protein